MPPLNETQEEINALLDDIDSLDLTVFEYDFIMDVAEKDFLSKKQKELISVIYKKYIEKEYE